MITRRKVLVLPVIISLLTLVSVSILATDVNVVYMTRVGYIIDTDSGINIKVQEDSGVEKTFLLGGKLVSELDKLRDIKIKITGRVTPTTDSSFDGEMEVMMYSLFETDVILGVLRLSREGLVLVGQNQIIYKITNVKDLDVDSIVNYKVAIAGDVQPLGKYYSLLKVNELILLTKVQ